MANVVVYFFKMLAKQSSDLYNALEKHNITSLHDDVH